MTCLRYTIVCMVTVLLLVVQHSPAVESDTNGLVFHMTFDGNLDVSTSSPVAPTSAKGTIRFVNGKHGQAVELKDGAYIVANLPATLGGKEFTLAFWLQPLWHPEDSLPHPIIEIPAASKDSDKIGWAEGQFIFSKGWSESIMPNQFYGVRNNKTHLGSHQWTYVVISRSAAGKFTADYFNGEGQRVPLGKNDVAPSFARHEIWLGSRADGKGGGDIILDDLRLYNRALDPAEIPVIAGEKFPMPEDFALLGTQCSPERAVPSPHQRWAVPLRGGPLNILAIVEGRRGRDFIELRQRMEINLTIVPSASLGVTSYVNPEPWAQAGTRIEAALLEKRYDCVIVASYPWNLLPTTTRTALLEYVENGGGLVMIAPRCVNTKGAVTNSGHGFKFGWEETELGKGLETRVGRLERVDEEYLTGGIPWDQLSLLRTQLAFRSAHSLWRGGNVGKGRLLIYNITTGGADNDCAGLTPSINYLTAYNDFDYDYAIAAAGRAALWAARRDPPIRITEVAFAVDAARLTRQLVAGTPGAWRVNIENQEQTPVKATVIMTLRNKTPLPSSTLRQEVTLRPGNNNVALAWRCDRTGSVFADARLDIEGKTGDWATGVAVIERGRPWLQTMEADKVLYAAGESPRLRFALGGGGSVTPGQTVILTWQLFDAYDRLSDQGKQKVTINPCVWASTVAELELPPLAGYSRAYTLALSTQDKGGVLSDQRMLKLYVKNDDTKDFQWFVWGGVDGANEAQSVRVLRNLYHLSGVMANQNFQPVTDRFMEHLSWISDMNLLPWIYATHLGSGTLDNEGRLLPDLADPAWNRGVQEGLRMTAAAARRYSPLFFSLGDEVRPGPSSYQPTALEQEAFRVWLKNRYVSIDVLNAALGTSFSAWSVVAIPAMADFKANKVSSKLVKLVKIFREDLFSHSYTQAAKAIHDVIPEARVGSEGIFGLPHPTGAMDYAKIAPHVTYMGLYMFDTGPDMGMVRSFLPQNGKLGCWYNYERLNRDYSLKGPWEAFLRGVDYFGWFTCYPGSGDWYAALNPDFTPLTQFAWTYSELQPLLEGIGKLTKSVAPREDTGVRFYYEYQNLHRTLPGYHAMLMMHALLEDIGIQFDFLSSQQIEAGALKSGKVKTLVLAGADYIPQTVAAEMQNFALAGGLLLSDILPGQQDLLQARAISPLASLFADLARGDMSGEKTNGRGKTLLLGRQTTSYRKVRMTEEGQRRRELVHAFFDRNGSGPNFQVAAADGSFQPCLSVHFRLGESRFLALQRDYRVPDCSPKMFTITAPVTAYVYDVRAGTYLGFGPQAKIQLEAAKGAMLAFLPYKALALEMQGLTAQVQPGEKYTIHLKLAVEGPQSDGGVFRIEVVGPDQSRVAALCSKLTYTSNSATFLLRFAHNDPIGTYTIHITDVATGTSVTQTTQLMGEMNEDVFRR